MTDWYGRPHEAAPTGDAIPINGASAVGGELDQPRGDVGRREPLDGPGPDVVRVPAQEAAGARWRPEVTDAAGEGARELTELEPRAADEGRPTAHVLVVTPDPTESERTFAACHEGLAAKGYHRVYEIGDVPAEHGVRGGAYVRRDGPPETDTLRAMRLAVDALKERGDGDAAALIQNSCV